MKQAITTEKPVRRLKQLCHNNPTHAKNVAGFTAKNLPNGSGIWQAIGQLPKPVIEKILAQAEPRYY